MFNEILKATADYQPEIFTCENPGDYLLETEDDYVFDYSRDLMVCYNRSYGTHQISYKDWVGDYDNPIPVLQLLLKGHVREVFAGKGKVQLLIMDEERMEG